jgi:hypothetical protein
MRSDRQRFIDECLSRSFVQCPAQGSGFLIARAVAFWEDREIERVRYEAEQQREQAPLAKTKPAAETEARSA